LATACALFGAWLHAASISGTVKDQTGAVVGGAAVSLQLPSGAALQTATDALGRFRFDAAAPGSHTLRVTKTGFETWERAVTASDKPVDVGVTLALKALLDSVRVSGRRSPLANSDPNYIALRGARLNPVYRVKNLTLKRDVGVFTLRSGSFSFLPPVLGQTVAGVFVGEGSFQLKPLSDIAVKHLHRMAGVDAVEEDFTAMVIYFSDSTFDEIKRHSEFADEAPRRHEEELKRVKEMLGQRREPGRLTRLTPLERMLNYEDIPNYEAELLAELYNTGRRGSFRAFLRGRKYAHLRFLLNPSGAMPMLPAPEEVALLNFDPASESDGVWYLSHIESEVRSGRASSKEDKRLVAPKHYKIEALIGAKNLLGVQPEMTATCDLRFQALEDGIRMVKFDMIPDLQVTRVAWDGKEIPFVQEGRKQDGSFYLQMPESLAKGRDYRITFEYSGREILQSSYSIPTRRVWYPTPAGPASRATYDLTFRYPHATTVVSVGRKVRQSRDGAFDVAEWISDVPISQAVFRYLTDVVSEQTVTDDATGMELTAYVAKIPGVLPGSRDDVLVDMKNSLRTFRAWFGPPSFDHLTVLVTSANDSLPGLVYVPPVVTAGYGSLVAQALSGARGSSRSMGPRPSMKLYLDEAFPLQLARQWWGNTVAPASFHDAWLANGFADFSATLYDVELKQPDDFRDHWVKARDSVLKPNASGFVANNTGPLWLGALNDTWRTPNAGALLGAPKGGCILQMLRSMMWDSTRGDSAFRSMMQDYVKEFANQSASTEDFKSVVEKHMTPAMNLDGNARMDWFFNEWVYGAEIPSYRLEYSLSAEKGGKCSLKGRLTQSGVSPDFKMIVPLFADLAGKKVRIGHVAIRGNTTQEIKQELPEAPKQVLLNVNHDVLTDREEVKFVK
jgi:hypothetical protein